MIEIFEDSEAWTGGFFQMVIRLGKVSANSADEFASVLWQYSLLEGPYRDLDSIVIEPLKFDENYANGYGIATLPQGRTAGRHYMMRFDDGTWESSFCFPMGALGRLYPVGAYPFEDGTPTDWIAPVSDWLVGLAQHVFQTFPFEIAIVGFEAELPEGDNPVDVPSDPRYHGYLKRSGMRLEWFPPTETDAPMTF